MEELIIYHNGECSKSRGALELAQEENIPHKLRWYLAEPLSREELTKLLSKLGLPPSAVIRKNEPVYRELFEVKTLTEEAWLDALVQYPVLLERPIAEKGSRAVIARPAEKLLELR